MDEIGALLRRRWPGYEVRTVVELGEGGDNLAYEVNGELIVRLSKEADPGARAVLVRGEAALLAVVAGLSTLPVPVPAFADPEAGALAYPKLPGRPLNERPVPEPVRLAPALGGFCAALHGAPVERLAGLVRPDAFPMGAWLEEARGHYREVERCIPAAHRPAIEEFLGRAPPGEPPSLVFCHNDLGAEHVLVDAVGAITGIIDWADAAIADPAVDLALIFRDLGPEVLDRTLDHYGRPWSGADRERMAFYARCALLEDLVYGFRGAPAYAAAGLAHLPWTFE